MAAAESPVNGYWDTLYRHHVNYIDSDGHVHELYKTPTISWKDNDLTKLAGSSTDGGAGSPLDGYWDTLSRQHVNYIDSERHVHELYNTPTSSWKDNDLTKLAGSSATDGQQEAHSMGTGTPSALSM